MSNSNNEPRVSESGGVTRMQWGAAPPDAPAPGSEILRGGVADGGNFRMTADGNVAAFGGITRHVSNSDINPNDPDILATIRTPMGSRPTKVEGFHRINCNGFEMTVDNAIRLGYVERTGEYTYRATGKHTSDAEAVAAAVAEHHADPKVNPARTQAPTLGQNLKIA